MLELTMFGTVGYMPAKEKAEFGKTTQQEACLNCRAVPNQWLSDGLQTTLREEKWNVEIGFVNEGARPMLRIVSSTQQKMWHAAKSESNLTGWHERPIDK